MNLKLIFPILQWLPNYPKKFLSGDLRAGLTVGVMLVPQGMAYAMIAGLPPVYGLYASIIPQLIYAILGTSRQLSVAPVAMDSLLVASGIGLMATQGSDAYISLAIMVGFFMGVFQFVLGVANMGFITNLLSRPVISGFTSAAAIIIALSQLPLLLGIEMERSNRAYEMIGMLLGGKDVHWFSILLGASGILIILGVKKLSKKIPGSLLAVIAGTIVVSVLGWDKSGVAIVNDVPAGFPVFAVPDFSWELFAQLGPLAMTIAVIAYMEAFSVAKAVETKRRDHVVKPSQELIALGASNVFASFFGSYPVTGGFSRTAVNVDSGANTPLSSLISAGIVTLTLVFLTPLFYFLPKAILASIIMVAVIGLIDFKFAMTLWKKNKLEFALLILTFLITLNVGMVQGIITGISLSILYLLYKMAYPHVAQLGRVKGYHEFRNIKRFDDLEKWEGFLLLRLDGPLSFINIQFFKDYVLNHLASDTDVVVLDAGPISYLDTSAMEGLSDLIRNLEEKDISFVMCDVIGPVRDVIHKSGFVEVIKEENIFLNLDEAVKVLTHQKEKQFGSIANQHEE